MLVIASSKPPNSQQARRDTSCEVMRVASVLVRHTVTDLTIALMSSSEAVGISQRLKRVALGTRPNRNYAQRASMIIVTADPITGRDAHFDPNTPHGALAEFYRAFNTRDLDLMKMNWLNSDEACMDNPLGGIRRGWSDISEVYQRLFNSEGVVSVEFFDYTVHESPGAFVAIGRERGQYRAAGQQIDLMIRTSRWFTSSGGRFRQLHHHGSIDDADLLARYQAAVR